MADVAERWSLTATEQEAIDNRALRLQARVIAEIAQTAALLHDAPVVMDAVRSQGDKKTLQRARRALKTARRVLGELGVQPTENRPGEDLAAVITEPTQEYTEPVVAEQPDLAEVVPQSLTDDQLDRARKLVGDDIGTEDIAQLARKIHELAGAPAMRRNARGVTPDPIERIKQYLEGSSYEEIAENDASTGSSVGQWFVALRRAIRAGTDEEVPAPTAAEPVVDTTPVAVPRPPQHEVRFVQPEALGAPAMTSTERDENLQRVVENPEFMSRATWLEEARASVVAHGIRATMTKAEAEALWTRVHYGDADEHTAEPTEDGKQALRILQQHFFARGKQRLANNGLARENVAVNMLTRQTPNGFNTLTEIQAGLAKLKKPYNHPVTHRTTEIHTVNGIITILKDA